MANLSILTGLFTAILFGINVVVAKRNLKDLDSNTHIFLKYASVSIFALFASIIDWSLTITLQTLFLITLVATTRAIYGYTYSYLLKEMNTAVVSFIIQSHVFLVLLIEILLGLEINYMMLIIAGVLLMIGAYLTLQVNSSEFVFTRKSIAFLFIAYISIGIRPFFIRPLLQTNSINSFTLLFFEFALTSLIFAITFKPKLRQLSRKYYKDYGIQGALSLVGNISSNYGLTYGIATITTMMLSFELVIVLLLSFLFLKERIKRGQVLGIIIGLSAIICIQLI